jgi:hypothetical protein
MQSDEKCCIKERRDNKYKHYVNNIEQNIGGPHSYISSYNSMLDVQSLYESKNRTNNVVDSTKLL